jgi:phage anti-repressor protein
MKELIKIETNENGKQAVSAKELYRFLTDIAHNYARWVKNCILENSCAEENKDYTVLLTASTTTRGGQVSNNYALTVDFAKELCMLSRNEKGKQARQYFISCEKELEAEINALEIQELKDLVFYQMGL